MQPNQNTEHPQVVEFSSVNLVSSPEQAVPLVTPVPRALHPSVLAERQAAQLQPNHLDQMLAGTHPSQQSQPVQEDEEEEMGLPENFDTFETKEHGTGLELQAFGEGCLECGHLIPKYETTYDACHWTKGNNLCPAMTARIVFVGLKKSYIRRIQKAQSDLNFRRVMKLLKEVENHDELSDSEKAEVYSATGVIGS